MPRFVLLFHDLSGTAEGASHWDLMLERDGALLTWRLPTLPAPWRDADGEAALPSPSDAAVRLHDHRAAYLEYEGPVSGNRGHVARVDRGEYLVLDESPEGIEVELLGQRGTFRLRLPAR